MPEERIKITPAKGRPMLRWVGKKPLDYVKGFPAQLVEIFDPLNTGQEIETPNYDTLKDNWQNLIFHGDNKEVMATLIENGFRGKIDLIYIDPPFMSGADYVRKVQLRGMKRLGTLDIDEASLLQQVMYEDMWRRDQYFQFMYERLSLMKELLSEDGAIYVHLNWYAGHYIKIIMDEIFGNDNLVNEVIWEYRTGGAPAKRAGFAQKHDTILLYCKSLEKFDSKFNKLKERIYYEKAFFSEQKDEEGRYYADVILRDVIGGKVLLNINGELIEISTKPVLNVSSECLNFDTQKSEGLLMVLLIASSDPNDIVMDCFIGSGTTARAAQQLGRRWIGCDINKGAVQMTSKTLQKIIFEQVKQGKKAKEEELPRCYSFGIYQVNNYDLQLLKTEATELAVQHVGIQRIRTDTFFDGTLGKSLVKIIDFNHPLTLLDLQLIQDELSKRPNEDRDMTIVCLGKELAVDPQIEEWNKKHPINKIKVIELKTDKRYGSFLIHDPAQVKIAVKRVGKDKAIVKIQDFISPAIIKRLNIESGLFRTKIPDFRCMIDTVLIDNDYDGKTFHIVYSDVPERKDYLVQGKYEIELPNPEAKVAVKVIDMLGEEVLVEFPPK
jgi:DNA modification methylase